MMGMDGIVMGEGIDRKQQPAFGSQHSVTDGGRMDPMEDFKEVTERLNQGEPIPTVDASRIERCWNVMSSIPKMQREHIALGEGAFAISDPEAEPLTAEQKVA